MTRRRRARPPGCPSSRGHAGSIGLAIALSGCVVESPEPGAREFSAAVSKEPSHAGESASAEARTQSFIGVIVARQVITIGSKHGGEVARVDVEIGEHISKGDVIATLMPRDAKKQVELKQSQLAEVSASLRRARLEAERARLVAAESEKLSSSGFLSADVLRKARLDRDAAAAEEMRLEAQLREREIELHQSRIHQQETSIVATEDGWIASKYVEPGSVVSAGDPVVRLLSAGERPHLRFAGPPTHPPKIGDLVRVSLERSPTRTYSARVTHIAPDIEPLTGMLVVRAEFLEAHEQLSPGTALSVEM